VATRLRPSVTAKLQYISAETPAVRASPMRRRSTAITARRRRSGESSHEESPSSSRKSANACSESVLPPIASRALSDSDCWRRLRKPRKPWTDPLCMNITRL
jgi:hypothetical protein